MDESFREAIRERIAGIELISEVIAEQGRETDVRDLRVLLLNVVSLLERDPGLEAAVDDLYAATKVIAKDAAAGVHPVSRNVRFLRSALARFLERAPAAPGFLETQKALRFQGLEAAYAVQLERLAGPEATEAAGERSAA